MADALTDTAPIIRRRAGLPDHNTNRRLFLGLTGSVAVAALVACGERGAAAARPAAKYQVRHTPAEWKKLLGPARYNILREDGTERPNSSPLLNEHRKGVFVCAGCALPVYSSATKFESGTGWPSFWQAVHGAVVNRSDGSFGMTRVEEHCRRCGGHLGHVFDDGPPPTGKRHCINGLSLAFRPA